MTDATFNSRDNSAMPILSICIPTFNRSAYLGNTLAQLANEDVFRNTDDVEIVVSDNCSTDDTEDVCRRFMESFGGKVRYFRQERNIRDGNFAFALGLARGKYAKLNNDNIFFTPGELGRFVSFLRGEEAQDVVFLLNKRSSRPSCTCETFSDLLDRISFNITWIGGLCVKTSAFRTLADPARYSNRNFSQVDIIARLMKNGSRSVVYYGSVMDAMYLPNKGGFSVPEIFGRNYLSIIDEIYAEGDIAPEVYRRHKKRLLLEHINDFSFSRENIGASRRGYFRFLLPYYRREPYFYADFIYRLFKLVLRCFFEVRKDMAKREKTVRFLCFSARLPRKRKRGR